MNFVTYSLKLGRNFVQMHIAEICLQNSCKFDCKNYWAQHQSSSQISKKILSTTTFKTHFFFFVAEHECVVGWSPDTRGIHHCYTTVCSSG